MNAAKIKQVKYFLKKHLLWTVIGAGLLVFAIVCIPYAFTFGGISSEHERWGQFGDYFGGILNPIFAFLGFIGVIISIQMQSRQQQADSIIQRLTLLETLVESRATQVKTLLGQHWSNMNGFVGRPYGETAPMSKLFETIALAPRKIVFEYGQPQHLEFADPQTREVFNSLTTAIMKLAGELAFLAASLKKWKDAGGDNDLIWHMNEQFALPIAYMHALGFSGSQKLFEEVFPNIGATIESVSSSIRVENGDISR